MQLPREPQPYRISSLQSTSIGLRRTWRKCWYEGFSSKVAAHVREAMLRILREECMKRFAQRKCILSELNAISQQSPSAAADVSLLKHAMDKAEFFAKRQMRATMVLIGSTALDMPKVSCCPGKLIDTGLLGVSSVQQIEKEVFILFTMGR